MFTVIIIDFCSYARTVEYINDFLKSVDSCYKISFVIVDNSSNAENYPKLINNLLMYGEFKENYKIPKEKYIVELVENATTINYKHNKNVIDIVAVKSRYNSGFAKGNNLGAAIARLLFEPKYLIFSNNDIKFLGDNFKLYKFTELFDRNREIALIGPRILGLDGKRQSPHRKISIYEKYIIPGLLWPLNSIINKVFKTKFFTGIDILNIDKNCFIYRIIGAFMVFDANKFYEINMFDKNTFLYAEELIIAEKLRKSNYKTYYLNDISLLHEEGYSTKKQYTSYKKFKQIMESEMYYYKEYIGVSKFNITMAELSYKFFWLKRNLADKISKEFAR